MKYCMMTYTVARQDTGKVDMLKICKLARELNLDALDQITLYHYRAGEIRQMAEDYSLKIICYTFNPNVNHSDPTLQRAGMDGFRKELDHAVELGVPMIMLPLRGKPELTREQSRYNLMKVLPEMVRLARDARITLTIEHFPGALSPFLLSDDMNHTIQTIPDLRITFDSGNILTGGEEPAAGFVNSQPWIVHTHFKDFVQVAPGVKGITGLDGKSYKPALIGEGLVNYPSLLRVMKDTGYSGYINIEYEGNEYPADEAIRRALSYLRRVEASLYENVEIN